MVLGVLGPGRRISVKDKAVRYYERYRYNVINNLTSVWVEGEYEHITDSVKSRLNWICVINHIYDTHNLGNWSLYDVVCVEQRRM